MQGRSSREFNHVNKQTKTAALITNQSPLQIEDYNAELQFNFQSSKSFKIIILSVQGLAWKHKIVTFYGLYELLKFSIYVVS